MTSPIGERLAELPSGERLRFSLGTAPAGELLLAAHTGRFTGCLQLLPGRIDPRISMQRRRELPPGTELLFFREGSCVGYEELGPEGTEAVRRHLSDAGRLDASETAAFARVRSVRQLALELGGRGLVDRAVLDGAVRGRALERLFLRGGDTESTVGVDPGLEALLEFHPVYVDVRPAIAFALVSHARAADKRAQLARAAGRRARLVAPYDERRNAYGLPEAILEAVRALGGDGVSFGAAPALGGLSEGDLAGLLYFLDRVGLLELSDAQPSAAAIRSSA